MKTGPSAVSANFLAARLTDRSMRGIARGVGALIRNGSVAVGTRLPSVREIAHALGVSPATVSAAWSELRQYRVISGRGRNGTWVSGDTVTPRPRRYAELADLGHDAIDLTMAMPDRALLPPLHAALAHAAGVDDLNSYYRQPIIPVLRQAVAARWPYTAEAYIATNGGFDAVIRPCTPW
jgi:DNA-binding transcriptional regulator YhcF (GntR family)